MALFLPPPPNANIDANDYQWRDWFRKLQVQLVNVAGLTWDAIDFTGSSITDIEDREHNDLQAIQGGVPGEYYHLTVDQIADLDRQESVLFVNANTQLTEVYRNLVVTIASTMTLPKASTNLIGKVWSVANASSGSVTVACTSGDTVLVPSTDDTSILITQKGTVIEFRCVSTNLWTFT